MARRRKKKYRGQWCWCCDCILPNESFSGKGHAKHLCKKCAGLGVEERAFRQAERNLERCVTLEGIIPRKKRKQFEAFLTHGDPRIRELALELQKTDALMRSAARDERKEEEGFLTAREWGLYHFEDPEDAVPEEFKGMMLSFRNTEPDDDDSGEIPF
ncbi:MAG: hypothetical protein O3C21_20500 [Verrucomicrobia bacterium]|nr:hypothetical protein [Verrucomicrobiota bacterium]